MKWNTGGNIAIQGIFSAVAGNFVLESINQMIPWLIVMFAVILCDLATGWRRCLLMNEEVRFSRAWRATFGKMVTYFSFVVMVVFINVASGGGYAIDKWMILFICFIEVCSIISNLLKPKGYNINLASAISLFLKKVFSIDREDTKDLIQKNKEEEK